MKALGLEQEPWILILKEQKMLFYQILKMAHAKMKWPYNERQYDNCLSPTVEFETIRYYYQVETKKHILPNLCVSHRMSWIQYRSPWYEEYDPKTSILIKYLNDVDEHHIKSLDILKPVKYKLPKKNLDVLEEYRKR